MKSSDGSHASRLGSGQPAAECAEAAITDMAKVSMTEDEYPLRLAAATRNPRCVAQAELPRDISEEEGIRPGVNRAMTARCPFEVVLGTDLCVRHLNGEKIPGELALAAAGQPGNQ